MNLGFMDYMDKFWGIFSKITELLLHTDIVDKQRGAGIPIHIHINKNSNLTIFLDMLQNLIGCQLDIIEGVRGLNSVPSQIEKPIQLGHSAVHENLFNRSQLPLKLSRGLSDVSNVY